MTLTPEQRVLRARLAAHVMHSRGSTTISAARAAFDDRFYREVDPDGTLPDAERERLAAHARKAYFIRLSLKAAAARQAKASSNGQIAATKAGPGPTTRQGSAAQTKALRCKEDNRHPDPPGPKP